MKKYSIILLVLIFSMSIVGSLALAKNTDSEPTIYIDSRLPQKDQIIMKKIMLTLDKEDRKNVLYIAEDGWFTANRLELIEEFKTQNKDKFDKDGKLKKIEEPSNMSPLNFYGGKRVVFS